MQQFLKSKVQDAKKVSFRVSNKFDLSGQTLLLYGTTKPELLLPRIEKTFAHLIEVNLIQDSLSYFQ